MILLARPSLPLLWRNLQKAVLRSTTFLFPLTPRPFTPYKLYLQVGQMLNVAR